MLDLEFGIVGYIVEEGRKALQRGCVEYAQHAAYKAVSEMEALERAAPLDPRVDELNRKIEDLLDDIRP